MPKLEGFVGPSYEALSQHFNAQRAENLYLEANQSKTPGYPAALLGSPGIRKLPMLPLVEDAAGALPTFPLRALWAGHNRAFAIAGSKLYEIFHWAGAVHVDGTTVTWVAGPLFADPLIGTTLI